MARLPTNVPARNDTAQTPIESWLRRIIREEIAALLDEEHKGADGNPALFVDRVRAAQALNICTKTLDRLRREQGFPVVWIFESPRFDLAEVRRWLASRNGGST